MKIERHCYLLLIPFSALTLLVGDRKDILPGRCGQEQIETTALSIIL